MVEGKAMSVVIPPPVDGWNTRDPISEMPPTYAVDCENFYSNGSSVDLREGYSLFTSGVGNGAVSGNISTSLLTYSPPTGGQKLIAVVTSSSGVTVYSIDSSGVKTDITPAAGQDSYNCTSVNFRGRIFLSDANAGIYSSPTVVVWNGTGLFVSAGFTSTAVNGFFGITSYKSRLYMIEKDTMTIWYGGVDAVTGALTKFDLQSIFQLGGRLLFCGSAGRSSDLNQEYFTAISNQGEVLLYQGDSPSSSTWSLVGRYFLPKPLVLEILGGFVLYPRCFFYWGQDLVIMTIQGVVLLSSVISGSSNSINYLSEKINSELLKNIDFNSLSEPALATGIFDSKNNRLIFKILKSNLEYETYVMSTVNYSWWKWTGINASSNFCSFNSDIYFWSPKTTYTGLDDARIFKLGGTKDLSLEDGTTTIPRTMLLRSSYNYLGDRSHVKTFTAARPVIYQSNGLDLTMGCDVDFANDVSTSRETDTSDTAYKAYQPMMGLNGVGKCASIRIDGTATDKEMSLQAIEVFYTQGGLV